MPGGISPQTLPVLPMADKRGASQRPCKKTIVLPQSLHGQHTRGRRPYSSSGNSFSSASENTGPSTHTYFGPTLHLPQIPIPHFMRFSSVV